MATQLMQLGDAKEQISYRRLRPGAVAYPQGAGPFPAHRLWWEKHRRGWHVGPKCHPLLYD